MSRNETDANTKVACEPRGLTPDNMVAKEVPAKEVLMHWVEDAERDLIGQLASLQKVKDKIRYADEYTCQIVRDLVRSDIRRHF